MVDLLLDDLFVCNLGSTDVSLYLKFAQKTVNDDLKVQLAHTCNNSLTRFLIRVGTEGGVLLSKFSKRNTHFLLTSLGLGLDSHVDNGLRENHGLKNNGMLFVAEGIAC